jgi:anti-anti-sigma factor
MQDSMKMGNLLFHKGVLNMFNYNIVDEESKSTVLFDGDMDIDVTEIMEEEIAPNLLHSNEIELNFENVSFVDSSGIGLLITLITDLQERGSKVIITHLSPDVKEVFSLLQLPEILGRDVFLDLLEDEEA